MKLFRVFIALLLTSACACYADATPISAPKTDALERIKALPPPLQSSSGTLFVSCATAERAALRWPVMRFAETVSTHLSDTFLPLGSATSPLSIELGAQTNAVMGIERRTFRTRDGFSQLIIRVPNPETVDLEVLREGVAEALLRERTREEIGRYSAFTWPNWFLSAVVNASKGNLWKAEAYEQIHEYSQQQPPTLEQILLSRDKQPIPELDAFFVIWLLEETRYSQKSNRLELLTTQWSAETLYHSLNETAWQKWLTEQSSKIFLPGALTRSQFKRWKASLTDPVDAADAVAQANSFARVMLARPQPFRDLCDLYLKAYTAYISGGLEAYQPLRQQADDAAAILDNYFTRHNILTEDMRMPSESDSHDMTNPTGISNTL